MPMLKVAPNELTCLRCGETYAPSVERVCPRCSVEAYANNEKAQAQPCVATVAYLRANEYAILGDSTCALR